MPLAHTFPRLRRVLGATARVGLISFSGLILISKGSRMGGNCSAVAIMHFFSSLLGPGHSHVVIYHRLITYIFNMIILGWARGGKTLPNDVEGKLC